MNLNILLFFGAEGLLFFHWIAWIFSQILFLCETVDSSIPLGDMGSELCANGSEMEGTISSNFVPICVIPKGDSPIVEEENVRRFPQSSILTIDRRTASIGSATLDSNRASVEPCQVMLVSSPPSVSCFDSNDDGSQTPKDSIFDPFAPVHDKFMLAPRRRKCMEESRNSIVRRLNFSSTTNLVRSRNQDVYNDTSFEEEQLFDIIYSDLMDIITSERTEEFASKPLAQVSDSDGFCTPIFAARFDGIAETCPGAPKKSISKYRNIDKKLCRKLEF